MSDFSKNLTDLLKLAGLPEILLEAIEKTCQFYANNHGEVVITGTIKAISCEDGHLKMSINTVSGERKTINYCDKKNKWLLDFRQVNGKGDFPYAELTIKD